jgi:signal transduction histidine kinase
MDEPVESDLNQESLIHDLNNVFETITEAAELLNSDRRWRTLAATLSRSVTRGKRLLGAIPDGSPNLAAIIDSAIQSITDYCVAARKPRMRFVRRIPPDVKLPGSSKDWERVFANLFLNAAEIMQRPGRIEVEAHSAEDRLEIRISDNGPGIPPEILPTLFRAHVSTKKGNGARSGLGLHIVASTVKKYSGRVTAENRERGSGAVISIFLPFN